MEEPLEAGVEEMLPQRIETAVVRLDGNHLRVTAEQEAVTQHVTAQFSDELRRAGFTNIETDSVRGGWVLTAKATGVFECVCGATYPAVGTNFEPKCRHCKRVHAARQWDNEMEVEVKND